MGESYPQSKSEYLERQLSADDEVREGLAEVQSEAGAVKLNKAMEKGKEREKWVWDKASSVANRIGRLFSGGGRAVEKAVQAVLGADVAAGEAQDWLSRKVGNAKDKFSDTWQGMQEKAYAKRVTKETNSAWKEWKTGGGTQKEAEEAEKRWSREQKREERIGQREEVNLADQALEAEDRDLTKKEKEKAKEEKAQRKLEKRYQEYLMQQRKKGAKESQSAGEMMEKEIEANEKEAKQREKERERRERFRAKLLDKQEEISQMLSQFS